MATFRFLHCADLHLDSPLRGLEADPEAPADKIRGATREALVNLVDYAIQERIDFVVAAGDLYDGDWQDWGTGHFLIGQVARLGNRPQGEQQPQEEENLSHGYIPFLRFMGHKRKKSCCGPACCS